MEVFDLNPASISTRGAIAKLGVSVSMAFSETHGIQNIVQKVSVKGVSSN